MFTQNPLLPIVFVLTLLLLIGSSTARGDPPDYMPGQVILRFTSTAMPDSGTVQFEPASFGIAGIDSIIATLDGARIEKLVSTYHRHLTDSGSKLERTFILRYDSEVDPQDLVPVFSALSEFEDVRVNGVVEVVDCGTFQHWPSDSRFDEQWNLHNESKDSTDIDAPEAWGIERGNDEIIGIIDVGTYFESYLSFALHPDINYYYNPAEDNFPFEFFTLTDIDSTDNSQGVDPDEEMNNVIGWNFWPHPEGTPDQEARWEATPHDWYLYVEGDPEYDPEHPWIVGGFDAHGLAVEGIAAAQEGDDGGLGESVVGVAPECRVYHVRNGYREVDVYSIPNAILHAAKHARIINMSWKVVRTLPTGGEIPVNDPLIRYAVNTAAAPIDSGGYDCVLVAGAGNAIDDATHLDVQWPARYGSVLAVGSMTQTIELWGKSAYGPDVGDISLVAPIGDGIPAHWHGSELRGGHLYACCPSITSFEGTSGAAPQVAGVAALIRARFPDLNQFEVKQRILRSAEFYWEDTTENRKKFGAGKLNAYRALTEWGEISRDVTWGPSKTRDGKYYVSGDLTIPSGASLTIEPGTVVKVAPDHEAGGTDTNRVEIVVEGELNIGTSGDPVVFESFTDSDPTDSDWVGIRIVSGSETSGLDNVIIRNAQVAIESEVALELGDVTLEDCESAVLNADVKVKSGGTLTVDPGTVFWVGAEDEDRGGVDTLRVEFVVDGELSISAGAEPVVFGSSAGTPTNEDWLGIWISEGATATMENVEIRNAYQAIGTRSTLTIRKGLIEDCARIGLSIGGDGQADFTVIADTLTIRDVPGTGGLYGIGVNLLGAHATLQLTNSLIENSDLGVLAYTDATLSMQADSIRGHSLWGVGVFDGAAVTMTGVTVEGNTYLGMKAYDGASVSATGCTFASNDWGAYVTPEGGSDPTVSFSGCTFAENDEGVRVASTSNVTLSDCDVLDQTSAGVYCLGGADISVTDTTLVDGNAAGISCDQSSPEIVWNKIQYNVAGISADNSSSPLVRSNQILYNTTGLYFINGSNADMDAWGGFCPDSCGCEEANTIRYTVNYHVVNLNEFLVIDAACNYYGPTVKAKKFYGDVVYTPYLEEEPDPPSVSGYQGEQETQALPKVYALSQNYPNPFNPTTTIRYAVPPPGGTVSIRIYNVKGQLVRRLVDEAKGPGYHTVLWRGQDNRAQPVASGVYFVQMLAPDFKATRKLLILK